MRGTSPLFCCFWSIMRSTSSSSPEGSLCSRSRVPVGSIWFFLCFMFFYVWSQERVLAFQKYPTVPAFLKLWKCFIVLGGWVVIFYPLQFSLFLSIIWGKLCWFQILCQKLSRDFISRVMSNLCLKLGKFKADNKLRIDLKKLLSKIP